MYIPYALILCKLHRVNDDSFINRYFGAGVVYQAVEVTIMRVIVIGGTGHVGTYLVPRLVRGGHEVVVVSRGQRQPYQPHPTWRQVEMVVLEREAAEREGAFGAAIRDLRPDAVVDMLCFTEASARQLVEALQGHVQRFLHCGTVWVHGSNVEVPMLESAPRMPIDDYGINKAAVERYLLDLAREGRFPATVLHPGHIVGVGWVPLNPQANFNTQVYEALARGEEITLPNLGLETMHHVHADDVAQAFQLALERWDAAVGESFFAVSRGALAMRGYAEAVAGWFGQQARLRFLPVEEWKATMAPKDAAAGYAHLIHSTHCSPLKAMERLGYQPRCTSLEAVKEALDWLIMQERVKVGEKSTQA
jgi:nucleoside-diphosphate-sugar epimerase